MKVKDLQDQLFPQPAMMAYLKKHDKLVIDTSQLIPGELTDKIWDHLQDRKVMPADYHGGVVPY